MIVALLVLGAVSLIILEAEPAAAAEPPAVAASQFEATPSSEPVEESEGSEEPADSVEPDDSTTDEPPARGASPLRISNARTSPSRIFLGSRRAAAFGFELGGDASRELLVKVVHVSSDQVVRRFRLGRVEAGSRERINWDGKLKKGGYAREGEYAFRVFSGGERAKTASKGKRQSSPNPRFGFYGHRFPLLARHTYGDGFGAGRDHQGQDVFAACGTRVVAARGGRIQARSYHSSAGYYIVVDGRGTGRDYAYMHLARGDRPPEGSWVSTGELIGRESDTGNASGCHLHFELWSQPGWYEGGRAKPATASLKRWDSWS